MNYNEIKRDKDGNTEAMILAYKGIIPSNKYYHDSDLKNNHGKTVCFYLWYNGIEVPEKW